MTTEQRPWQRGPAEVLGFALQLMRRGTDLSERLAFLLIDVGVEMVLRVYLQLPDEVSGARTSYSKRREACEGSFHDLVDGVRDAAGDRIQGVSLAEVKYLHTVRNKLYHEGDGVTVRPGSTQEYAEIVVKLLEQLLEATIEQPRRPLLIGYVDKRRLDCELCRRSQDVMKGPVYMLPDSMRPVCFECGCGDLFFDHLLAEFWECEDKDSYMDEEQLKKAL